MRPKRLLIISAFGAVVLTACDHKEQSVTEVASSPAPTEVSGRPSETATLLASSPKWPELGSGRWAEEVGTTITLLDNVAAGTSPIEDGGNLARQIHDRVEQLYDVLDSEPLLKYEKSMAEYRELTAQLSAAAEAKDITLFKARYEKLRNTVFPGLRTMVDEAGSTPTQVSQ